MWRAREASSVAQTVGKTPTAIITLLCKTGKALLHCIALHRWAHDGVETGEWNRRLHENGVQNVFFRLYYDEGGILGWDARTRHCCVSASVHVTDTAE